MLGGGGSDSGLGNDGVVEVAEPSWPTNERMYVLACRLSLTPERFQDPVISVEVVDGAEGSYGRAGPVSDVLGGGPRWEGSAFGCLEMDICTPPTRVVMSRNLIFCSVFLCGTLRRDEMRGAPGVRSAGGRTLWGRVDEAPCEYGGAPLSKGSLSFGMDREVGMDFTWWMCGGFPLLSVLGGDRDSALLSAVFLRDRWGVGVASAGDRLELAPGRPPGFTAGLRGGDRTALLR